MIVSRASAFLVFAVSGLLIIVEAARLAGSPESELQTNSRGNSSDLQLVVEVAAQRYRVSENPSFKISFRNSGDQDLLLNGGELLGNGAEIWSSIKCDFQSAAGQRLPLSLGWGVPGIAGRIYFLGVPLRAGSGYTVSVTPKDYYVGKSEHLAAGTYGLACTYTGAQSIHRDSTQLPRCWEGLATSNTARVEMVESNR
jgi:hypothetical protein